MKHRADTEQRQELNVLTNVLRARQELALAISTQPTHLQCGTVSNPTGYNEDATGAYIESIE
ncbi:uncharacterized protein EAF01_003754 [Botrytis porri]|uniref:uncharacterized protein n=1 Tax=Botrytis porri TaxID=87229 RepID=UPI0019005BA4|nr:uncharacterized protein EAF01_003754 [Botrytis porri]KAF7910036.1 hypothetical protein EAF01_003754 [Botrytis porri]